MKMGMSIAALLVWLATASSCLAQTGSETRTAGRAWEPRHDHGAWLNDAPQVDHPLVDTAGRATHSIYDVDTERLLLDATFQAVRERTPLGERCRYVSVGSSHPEVGRIAAWPAEMIEAAGARCEDLVLAFDLAASSNGRGLDNHAFTQMLFDIDNAVRDPDPDRSRGRMRAFMEGAGLAGEKKGDDSPGADDLAGEKTGDEGPAAGAPGPAPLPAPGGLDEGRR